MMKLSVCLASCLIVFASAVVANAETIVIDPGDVGDSFPAKTIAFSELNGQALDGSSLTLDFIFEDDKFVQLMFNDPGGSDQSYDVTVALTHSGASNAALPNPTVYLTDENGANIGNASSVTKLAAGNTVLYTGSFLESLFDNVMHHDVHFEIVLPTTMMAAQITGATLTLAISSPQGELLVGQSAPSEVSTASTFVGLLSMGIMGLIGHGWLKRRSDLSSSMAV